MTPASSGAELRARFAPSPTGYLHIGSARTALFNWLLARHTGGQFLLRIEDTDLERSKPELIDLIFRTLEWLGLDWDGDVLYQSQRAQLYRDAAERLVAEGRAYHCDCTQDDVKARAEARGGKPGYDGHCRDRGVQPGPGVVVRFRTPDEGTTAFDDAIRGEVAFPNADLEDFVIVRSNGEPMFLVANAVDDGDMGVTHILRGEDLLNVTPKTLLLREALGYPMDGLVFGHLPLIVNERRQKLSKRRDDVSVEDYKNRGFLPEAFTNYLATLGWGAPDGVEIRPIGEIVGLFDLGHVSKAPAAFDVKKLEHFDGEYIRALPVAEFIRRCEPWLLGSAAPTPWPEDGFDPDVFAAVAPLVQERVRTLAEVPEMVDFLFGEPVIDTDAWAKVMSKDPDLAVRMLDAAIERLAALEPWSAEGINDAVIGFADAHEISRKKAQAPVRVAVTGRTVGPPLWESMAVLGRERTLTRLRAARSFL